MNHQLRNQRGSIVLVGLILTAVLGLVLSSYIAICTNALQLSQREHQSARALQLAENGMEVALWALNEPLTTGFVDGTLGEASIDWTIDSTSGTASATISGIAPEGDITKKIGILIFNYPTPTSGVAAWSPSTAYTIGSYAIVGGKTYCCTTPNTGHSPAPISSVPWNVTNTYAVGDYVSYGGVLYRCKRAVISPAPIRSPENSTYWTPFWTTGEIINTEGVIDLPTGAKAHRQLHALISPITRRIFLNALAAVNGGTASLSSSGGTIDSYDSSIGSYDPSNPLYAAIVAGNSVNIRSATVLGYTATAGSNISYSATGELLAPGETTGRNLARMSTNMYSPLPPISAPTSSPTTLHDGGTPLWDSSWTTPINTLNAGLYRVDNDLHIGNADSLTIEGPGIVKLIVPGNLSIGDEPTISSYRSFGYTPAIDTNIGSGRIVVNTDAKLEIYVGGNFGFYAGGIINNSQNPANVTIYGSTTSSSPACDIRTNTAFFGTIYMPNGTFTLFKDAGLAPSAPNVDFHGAVVARNINLRGGASLHYDIALRNVSYTGVSNYRSILLWREIDNPSNPEFHSFIYP